MDYELRSALHFADVALQKRLHSRGAALRFQQVDDVLSGAVAKELSERLFVIGNAMLFDERDEIRRRVACQRRLGEVFVPGDEMFGLAMDICEIATAPAGDQDFLADAIGMLEHGDAAPAFAGLNRAEKSRGAAAENQGVKFVNQEMNLARDGIRRC